MRLRHARICGFLPGDGEAAGVAGPAYDDADWLEVRLPVQVHTALVEAGLLPDPYRDANATEVAWVAQREWWYRCRMAGVGLPKFDGERIRLVCHGLDTHAQLWLNGSWLGEHHSMFRPAEFDVTELLDFENPNTLALCFAPILDDGADIADVTIRDQVRARQRKMQVAFGWDMSCVLLTVGVWEPIELRRDRVARLGPVSFSTVAVDHTAERAVVRVGAVIDLVPPPAATAADTPALTLDYRLAAPDGVVVAEGPLPLDMTGDSGSAYAVIEKPQLWWTHDLGDPVLHHLTLMLRNGTDLLDSQTRRVGVRTLELDQSPDQHEPGRRHFRFVLNGQPLFARGANWVPDDLAAAMVQPESYQHRIGQAAAANMNMIRVWGGGIYEKDAFYDACDELGLLVWQDFMFAGLPYPNNDKTFLDEAEDEASYQVSRLQPHACLALWCGNNEAQLAGSPEDGLVLFADVLPRVVAEKGGGAPYWPGSPYGGNGPSSTYDGDTHDWRGFHGTTSPKFGEEGTQDPTGPGRHWRQYAEDVGRFVSEFGFASPAMLATIRRWISPAGLRPDTRSWQDRIRYVPGDSHVPLLETITGLPDGTTEWVDFIQVIQAEGVRFGIERFRERKPHCSGALVWQLNDCWPGFTWSLIDFDGRPKPSYYAVRRAFAPALATVNPLRGGAYEVWLSNDSADPIDDVLAVSLVRFDGELLHCKEIPVRAAPNSSAQLLHRAGWGRVLQPRSCYVRLDSRLGSFPANAQLFADLRSLDLPTAAVSVMRQQVDAHTVRLLLRADAFVPMIAVEHPDSDPSFDDNYFPLHPAETRTVTVHDQLQEIQAPDLTVRCLYGRATIAASDA